MRVTFTSGRTVFLLIPLLIATNLYAVNDTLIKTGSVWNYLDNGSNQGTAWKNISFNDASWNSGPSQLGYGDGDEATVVSYGSSSSNKYITTYFRKTISVSNLANYTSLTMKVKRDDGIVVYINGTERYRSNLGSGSVSYTKLASNASDDGNSWITVTLSTSHLVSGTNVIAAEIHQTKKTSSDISFDMLLYANYSCGTPSGLSTTGITNTSATANWSSGSGSTNYILEYKPTSSSTWTSVSAGNVSSYNITGLQSNTSYNWRVSRVCVIGTSSVTSTQTFTTLAAACNTPSGLTTTSITTNGATLNWNGVTGASTYNIRYRIVGNSTWSSTINTSNTTASLTGLNYNTNYEWQVLTNCVYGNQSAWSASSTFTTTTPDCNIPGGLATGSITNSGASVSWLSVSGASDYDVHYRVSGAPTWSASINTSSTTLNLTGLNADTSYEWQVLTNCIYGNQSAWSATSSFLTLPPDCEAATGLTASNLTTNSATLLWSNVANSSDYDVQYRPVGGSTWISANSATNTISVTSLTPASVYEWQVKSNCIFGNSSAWVPGPDFTTLTPPCNDVTNLNVAAVASFSADLTWDAAPDAISYNINYRVSGNVGWNGLSTTNNAITLMGLTPGTEYEWTAQSVCLYSGSNNVNGVNFITTIPPCNDATNLTSSNVSTTAADLNWDAIGGAVSYNVNYRVSGTTTWSNINVTNNTANIQGLMPASEYEWQVQAVCQYSNSGFVNGINFNTLIPPCNDAANLSASNITAYSAQLNWDAVAGALSYQINYRQTGAGSWNSVSSAVNSYAVTGLTPVTEYEWQIQAVCQYQSSNFINGANFTTVIPPCDETANLMVTNITTTSADLAWAAVAGAIDYNVNYRLIGNATWTSINVATNAATLTGLSIAGNYEWQVQTVCQYSNSNFIDGSPFTTLTPPCNSPANLSVSNLTTTAADLDWDAVTDALSYNVNYRIAGSSTWTTVNTVADNVSLTSLTPASNYEWQVQTVCQYSNSGFANGTGFTTLTPPCSDASNLSTPNIGTTSVDLLWDAVPGAVSYNVNYRVTGNSTWSTLNVTINWATLSGLTPVSEYEWQVQSVCSYSNSSFISGSNFNTLMPDCSVPSGLSTTTVTSSSADVSWNAVSGASSYDVQYREVGAGSWNAAINTSNTTLSLSGLNYSTNYEWQVRTNCIYGNQSAYSASEYFATPLPACDVPSGLNSSSITTSSANVSWNAVSGASSYDLQYREAGAGSWNSPVNTSNTSLTLSGLNYNTSYEWQVLAYCFYGNQSAYSTVATFITLTPVCDVPAGLVSNAVTTSSADVSWIAVTGAASYDVQYREVGAGSWSAALNTTNTTLTLNGLNYNTSYEWQVRTNCVYSNQSVYSNSELFLTLTPDCNMPSGLNTSSVTSSTAVISWSSVSGAASYDVQYREVGAGSWNAAINTTNTSLTLTGLNYSANYEWQVRTNCIYGNQSIYTASETFTTPIPDCNVPSGLSTTSITTASANVSWNAVTGAASYDVQYREVGAGSWNSAINTTNTSLTLSGLNYSTNYEWQVRTNCVYGNQSAYSSSATFTTSTPVCSVPAGLGTSSVTTNSALAFWNAVTGAASYDVQYRVVGAGNWNSAINTTNTSLTLSGLNYSTNYEWQVRTNCVYGNQSAYSSSATFTTSTPVCSVPTGLGTSSVTTNSALVSWSAVTGAASYDVQYRVVGAGSWNSAINTTNTSLTLSGLNYSANYEWQVRTNCVYGNQSAYSSSSNFTTLTPACNVPSGLATSSITSSSANASWSAVSGASSYDVQYRVVGAGSWNSAINTTSASLSLTGLAASTNYEWQVRTNCIYGNQSAYSASATFTTSAATPCNTPTGLAIASVTTTGATASWTAVSGAVSYTLHYRLIGAATWTTPSNTTSTSMALTGLTASRTYEVQVSTNCSGNSSAYSESVSFTTSASSTILTRGAYLQMVTPTSIRIRWRSSSATNSQVRYGTTMSYSFTATDATSTTEHEVALSGLTPGTKYFYTIGSTTVDYQGDVNNYFYTAPATGSTGPIRIWATGDFGNNTTNQDNVRNAMETYTTGNRPTLWIWQGDNAYSNGTDNEYQNNVFNKYPLQLKTMPVYPCLGNHDYAQSGYKSATSLGTNFPYFSMFTCPTAGEAGGVASASEKYYSYNYGNVHFIVLDSYGSLNASGSPMYNWLQSDLAANTQRFVVVMWHHPPYSMGTHNSDTESEMKDMRQNINPLLEQYKVDLVINGHSHNYERTWLIKGHFGLENTFTTAMKVDTTNGLSPYYLKTSGNSFDGTVYVVNGCSGQGGAVSTQSSWPHAAMRQYSKTLYGSMILDISNDTLDAKFLTSTNTIYDRFKIVKSGTQRYFSGDLEKKNEDILNVFPNPFSNELHLSFTLGKSTPVQIEVFDLLGNRIYSTGNKYGTNQIAGEYELELSHEELGNSSGILTVRMTLNDRVINKLVERIK